MTCLILAFAYSLTQSCKLCNVNPYDYWEDLLTNSCNPTRTIDSFMPHLWRNNHNPYYKNNFFSREGHCTNCLQSGSNCLVTQVSDTY